MSTPVYLLVVGKNNISANLAWKAMPETERNIIEEQQRASSKAVGATTILACYSAWADEEHPWWGIERFPSLEARMEHVQTLRKIGWLDYMDAFTLLGTSTGEAEAVTMPDPIYCLWMIRSDPTAENAIDSMPKGINTLMWEKHNAIQKEFNGQILLYCNSYWCNESYLGFGVSAYPDFDTLTRQYKRMEELGWRRYMNAYTILGKGMGV
jgi:hypothetical protein